MPTERFFRLPEEKQRAIRNASFREFARVPFDKASINRIIKDADISRGSFYTYFEDKRDALEYNCSYVLKFMSEKSEQHLAASGGNIWMALQKVLESLLDFFNEDERADFCRNAFAFLSSRQALSGAGDKEMALQRGIEEESRRMMQAAYDSYLEHAENALGFDEFFIVQHIAYMAMMGCFKAFFEGVPKEQVLENYRFVLDVLENGVRCGMQPEPVPGGSLHILFTH